VTDADRPRFRLWCDLETTGLEWDGPSAAILEAAFVLTTVDLVEVASASAVVSPPGASQDHDALWASMPEVVRQMHRDNGLWQEATRGGTPMLHVEPELLGWLDEHGAVAGSQVWLAGSGVAHFDRFWVQAHMPRLASRLDAYYTLDVGEVRRALHDAGVRLPGEPAQPKVHRAVPDVRYALELGRVQRAALRGAFLPVGAS
jgi:oligoribonuclease (3'-5' exoribonuclease)